MKKMFLLLIAGAVSLTGFARRNTPHTQQKQPVSTASLQNIHQLAGTANKATGDGDTLELANITGTDTITAYTVGSTADSGFITGPNVYGDRGFAERYDFNGGDSSLQVLGVVALFHGAYNPASTNMVNFKVWDVSAQVPTTDPNIFFSGFPNNVLTSRSVPVTSIGIDNSGMLDTPVIVGFSTPTAFLTNSFFVGYDINYNFSSINGDKFGLISSLDGERTSPFFSVNTAGDTVINVQNATEYNDPSDTMWHDNATDNFFLANDLYIFPIVKVKWSPTGVNTVVNKNLTFSGNYPNPATNVTNVQYSLSQPADVTVQIMDMSGHELSRYDQKGMGAGAHMLPMDVTALSAGTYIYILRTSNGAGIASKLAVVK
ncbi:T9SS type A sorting domain-containing protein [Chitinophagaceae bacterium MMS25-I14]